jgi:hypothetical protein
MTTADPHLGHRVDSPKCWCGPDVVQICPMCGGSAEGCGYCLGQTGYKGLAWEYDEDLPAVIIHHDLFNDEK